MNGRTDGQMDGRMDGWTDGWMDGWMDIVFLDNKKKLDFNQIEMSTTNLWKIKTSKEK